MAGAPGDRLAPRRRARPGFLLLGVTLAAILAVALFTTVGRRQGAAFPKAGGPMPGFSLPRVAGSGTVGVPADGGGNGRPAVVLFFASWCTPCQAEIPALAAIRRHQVASHSKLAKVALVGVDGNDPTASAVAFLHESGVTFPVGADRTYAVTSGTFGFTALPESIMVDANGTIAAIHYGALSTGDLVRWQQRLVAGG